MRYLNKINNTALQSFAMTGNPGQRIVATVRFLPSQELWMMDLVYNDFILNGIIITQAPNLLRGYKNLIPFGMACQCIDNIDPHFIDDFATQRARLYLLTAAEVEQIEQGLFE
jgi:hypothetical protein